VHPVAMQTLSLFSRALHNLAAPSATPDLVRINLVVACACCRADTLSKFTLMPDMLLCCVASGL
jgi:hypothetical protein